MWHTASRIDMVALSDVTRNHEEGHLNGCLSYVLFLTGCTEDDAGGSEGEEGAVLNDATLFGIEFDVVDEGAGVAVVVFQGVFQCASFVAADGDGAVIQVDAGVNGLEGAIG